jgi:hypothetical protein
MKRVSIIIDTHNTQTIKNFNDINKAIKHLLTLCTEEERLEVFGEYCKWCGTDKLPCHCNNDE